MHFFVPETSSSLSWLLYEFIWVEYGSISWVIELILSCTRAVPYCSKGQMNCLIELGGSIYVCVCQRLSANGHKIDTPQCSSDYCCPANCLSNNQPPQPFTPPPHLNTHTHTVLCTHSHVQTVTGQAAQKPFPIPR